MEYRDFALIIKENRIKKKLTQKEMSLLIPMSRQKYNYIENGIREPSFIELVLICNILNIDFSKETKIKEVNKRPHFD